MSEAIVLFDGVCNLCNASVQFIIKRDPKAKIRFASLQSAVGQSYLKAYRLSLNDFYSIILIYNNRAYQRSDAALQIARILRSPWHLLYYVGRVVPKFIRDGIYEYISKRRYKLFGQRDECMIPTPELKQRFL